MIDWTQVIIPIISAFAGAASGWLFGRRQAKAQAQSYEIANMIQVMEQWKNLYEEVKERLEKMENQLKNEK